MRILLSIKPEYVEQIERHTKLFEFRKENLKVVSEKRSYIVIKKIR